MARFDKYLEVDIKTMVVSLDSAWAEVEVKSNRAEGRISFLTAYTVCWKEEYK